jgi:hypothetical protein
MEHQPAKTVPMSRLRDFSWLTFSQSPCDESGPSESPSTLFASGTLDGAIMCSPGLLRLGVGLGQALACHVPRVGAVTISAVSLQHGVTTFLDRFQNVSINPFTSRFLWCERTVNFGKVRYSQQFAKCKVLVCQAVLDAVHALRLLRRPGTDLKGSIFAYNDKESMSGYHSMRHWVLLHKSSVGTCEPFFRSSVRTVRPRAIDYYFF